MKRSTKTVRRDDLEKVVSELLDIPFRGRKGEAYEIVNTILRVMTDAFWRGENVHIEGLGIFKVKTRGPRSYAVTMHQSRWKKGLQKAIIYLGPRKYVHFTPYKSVIKALNEN